MQLVVIKMIQHPSERQRCKIASIGSSALLRDKAQYEKDIGFKMS